MVNEALTGSFSPTSFTAIALAACSSAWNNLPMSDETSHSENQYEKGMATRRSVLGGEYVDGTVANRTEFNEPFQQLITDAAWGGVWSRDDISKRERSMLTIALLAALGHHEELELHLHASKNTGTSADDIREALLHVAIYGGVPAANSAMKIAQRVLVERSES